MNEWHSDTLVLEEIFSHSSYFNKVTSKDTSRKHHWRDVEILKEKIQLKKELLELRNYV